MSVRIDGMMVMAGALIVGGVVAWSKRGELLNLFNPTSDQNLAYRGAGALGDAVGIPDTDSRGVPLDDYIFAGFDLLNPFNESDTYARQVWGIEGQP